MSIFREVKIPLQKALTGVLEKIGYKDTILIFSNQNGLEPDKTYGIIDIFGVNQIGWRDEATFLTDDEELESITHHKIITQIKFLGTKAEDVAYDFRHALVNDRRCFEYLLVRNFGINERGDVRRVPQPRDTAWVDSFNMDINFSFAVRTIFKYDWIEYVDIDGTIIHREPRP